MAAISLEDPITRGAERIVLLGVTGSGKSTIARRVERERGIPAVDIDALAWRPGWVKTPEDELAAAAAAIAQRDAWVLDSAWRAILPAVLPRTQLVVALDLPRRVSLTRLLRRTVVRLVTRAPVCGENVESLGSVFSHDSIIAWHFRSYPRKREQIATWESDPQMPPVLRLRSSRDVENWVAALGVTPDAPLGATT